MDISTSRVLRPILVILWTIFLIGSASCDQGNTTTAYRTTDTSIQESANDPTQSTWIIDPLAPGQNLPPEGRSLFDFLTTETKQGKSSVRVPFPFTALLRHIEETIGSNEPSKPWKGVLVPFNRSLQRHASKPEYLTFPRAVVAIDTEPPLQKKKAGLLLKDRLFLGYQEKSNILEIISYNEAAGRFEFQVVTNYGPDMTPTVQYANRTLCITCHQNHSPIFSKPLWKETNSNPVIASLLNTNRPTRYGIPIHQSVDVSQAIDDSTHRANTLSVAQFLWQEGCEKKSSFTDSVRCRGDLLQLLLQYRLHGRRHINSEPQVNGKSTIAALMEGWRWKWPQGLLISSPDIPNRDPFEFIQVGTNQPNPIIRQVSQKGSGGKPVLRSVFEPSLHRIPTVLHVKASGREAQRQILNSFSQFLAQVDIQRLDRHLVEHHPQEHPPLFHRQGSCKGTIRGLRGTIDRVMVQCHPTDSRGDQGASDFLMESVFYIKNGRLIKGLIERLRLGDGQIIYGLEVVPGIFTLTNRGLKAQFGVRQPYTFLRGRQANGMAIKEISFEMTRVKGTDHLPNQPTSLKGRGSISVENDFSTVEHAVKALVDKTIAGHTDALAYKPFRRAVIMKALFNHLQMPTLTWCCVDDQDIPPAVSSAHDHRLDKQQREGNQPSPPGLKLLQKYCADCHHEEEPFPPNFLHGNGEEVRRQVQGCASRMLVRVQMWGLEKGTRPEAPMPPESVLLRKHIQPKAWPEHADFSNIAAYLRNLMQENSDHDGDLNQLLAQGYDHLPDCMARNTQSVRQRPDSVES